MAKTPKAGDPIDMEDFEMILEAVGARQKNFPNEPAALSMALVFFNIGDRFAHATCTNGEWIGLKQDIPKTDGDVPTCPDGHPLMLGYGLKIGWIQDQ